MKSITSLKEIFHVKEITSQKMLDAIQDWYDLYYGEEQTDEHDNQRLAYTIVRKLTKNIFSEYSATGENEFEKAVLEALGRARKKAAQHMLIGGECFLKPLIFDKRLDFMVIPKDETTITGRTETNEVNDICTETRTELNGKYYTLCERRYIDEDGKLTIQAKLYRSDTREYYGKEVPLAEVPQYADVEPEIKLNMNNIGLIPFVCPAENCIDGTDDPVSIYAAASKLIHDININEQQINGEFERGKSRIIASEDYLKQSNGKYSVEDDVFTWMPDDPENVGLQIFAPAFREQSYLARKTEYLRNIESIIGLKRGLLSDVETEDKTATEITSSAGDYNLTVIDFQQAWEDVVKTALKVTSELYTEYRLGDSDYNYDEDIAIDWGNGVLYDENKTWNDYMLMVQSGLLKPEIAIAWYFGKDHTDPKVLEQVRTDFMPQLTQMMGEQ